MSAVKRGLDLLALLLCLNVQSLSVCAHDANQPIRFTDLTSAQQAMVNNYIRENERPSGELKVLANRGAVVVRSSPALQELFPDYRFVVVPWVYEASSEAARKFSLPGGLFDTLAVPRDRQQFFAFHSSGNAQAYADFLFTQNIRIVSQRAAMRVVSAFSDIYGIGMGAENRRRGASQWLLGYREYPFRAISSYEEVREASYYLLETDSRGLVLRGRLMTETLARRKIH